MSLFKHSILLDQHEVASCSSWPCGSDKKHKFCPPGAPGSEAAGSSEGYCCIPKNEYGGGLPGACGNSEDPNCWKKMTSADCEFKRECKRRVIATRTDQSRGWGMDLKFNCGDNVISIGNTDLQGSDDDTQTSKESSDVYILSRTSCPSVVNKSNWLGGFTWDDTFNITVSDCLVEEVCKRKVTATRKDQNKGWGMDLKFKCGDNVISIGPTSKGGSSDDTQTSKESSEVYNLSEISCPSRVDNSNWLGGFTYGDYFDITVSECEVEEEELPNPEEEEEPHPKQGRQCWQYGGNMNERHDWCDDTCTHRTDCGGVSTGMKCARIGHDNGEHDGEEVSRDFGGAQHHMCAPPGVKIATWAGTRDEGEDCWESDDWRLNDANCKDGLLCARVGYDGRDFGHPNSPSAHKCTKPPACTNNDQIRNKDGLCECKNYYACIAECDANFTGEQNEECKQNQINKIKTNFGYTTWKHLA